MRFSRTRLTDVLHLPRPDLPRPATTSWLPPNCPRDIAKARDPLLISARVARPATVERRTGSLDKLDVGERSVLTMPQSEHHSQIDARAIDHSSLLTTAHWSPRPRSEPRLTGPPTCGQARRTARHPRPQQLLPLPGVQFGGSLMIDRVNQSRVVDATSNHWLCGHHRGTHANDPCGRLFDLDISGSPANQSGSVREHRSRARSGRAGGSPASTSVHCPFAATPAISRRVIALLLLVRSGHRTRATGVGVNRQHGRPPPRPALRLPRVRRVRRPGPSLARKARTWCAGSRLHPIVDHRSAGRAHRR